MKNFRLQIENINRSQSLAIDDSPITAFTIVSADKGPRKPYYIPAGRYNLISEVFGYPSAANQELQEVYDLNGAYGCWVSAPYTPLASKLPVAYVTPAGVFASHTPVTLGASDYVEEIEEEGNTVEGISGLSSDPTILIPVGQEANIFTSSSSTIAPDDVLSYDSGTLSIALGFAIMPELTTPTTSDYHFLRAPDSSSPLGPQVIEATVAEGDGILTFIIPGVAPIDVSVSKSDDDILLKTGTASGSGTIIGTMTAVGAGETVLEITGNTGLTGDYATYFSTSVMSTWSDTNFISTVRVYWKADVNSEAVTASMYPKYLSARDTTITFAESDFNDKFTNTVSETIVDAQASCTFPWSLNSEDLDGFGSSLEVTSKVETETLLNIHIFKTFDGISFTKTAQVIGPTDFTLPPVILTGGVREAADVAAAWSLAQDSDFEDVNIFFSTDTPADDSTFFSLSTTHPLARFVFPKPVTAAAAITTLPKLTYGYQYWALTGRFSRKSSFSPDPFATSLIGHYVRMLCSVLEKARGGIAPMYLNDARGLGGQLPVTVRKTLNAYKYRDEQLRILDSRNYNPIILGPAGVMVTSQKTCAAGEISDWSFIGHVSAFLDFQKEVKQLVMTSQIGKANNDYYRELRATQVADLLALRTEGTNRIWTSGSVDTSAENVNTADIRSQRLFKLVVTVKVDIFSEGVVLQFISEGQV